ncbi:GNAT family N-acetyltransferase [Actinoplanes sp. NBRC 101535]|uniref:GNAT family N-acetyltransferase n=1 Tax=Actinoplanes sp. NBRC 101535 TaxID=3032196 RepID=UPI0024A050EC|nr:GNAT family N-acetyltransferase [Actinoplanes sp. NBRC 101535]GLY04600.1 hypothetical protein Acsp01_49790 [Actinoplanes sp. NBRC 101535]
MRLRRDDYGIPHLRAGSVLELAYLQGRVTATDRGRQLTVERRRSEGTLAEIAGAEEAGWDVFARRARLDDTARRSFANLSGESRAFLEAYANGVRAAGVGWHPWSSIGVFLVQNILFGTFPSKMWRAHVARTLGPEAVKWFAVEGPDGSGSNAWAVPGLIAGDPHRVLELPGIYQQVRLSCPEFDVAGLTFPGVPGVQHFGHTGTVAWAVTNAMADYQDLFTEEVRQGPAGTEVRGPGGWEAALVLQETVFVRDADPITIDVVETPRGPVVDGPLSLRTPARAALETGFDTLLPLLRARTADDVADAFAHWVEPVNSVLTADTTGRILQLTAGRVPVRDDRNRWYPVPAWDSRYEWKTGWADLAREQVPDAVNANDRRPDTAMHGIDFAPPLRAERIRALLDAGAGPRTIHMDTAYPVDSLEAGRQAAWRAAVARALHEHPALAPLFEPSGHDPLFAPWTDPRARIGYALDGVLAGLGLDPATLADPAAVDSSASWGDRHLLHAVQLPGLSVSLPTIRLGGSGDCVLNTASIPGVTDVCWRGPVARYVWDLTDRSRSGWIVPFGASGDPSSPHFLDQLPLWSRGELIPVFDDRASPVSPPEDLTMHLLSSSLPGLGELSMIPLDPAAHGAVVHAWVTKPRNRFWGMGSNTLDEVRDIYEFLAGLDTHHAYLLQLDDEPIGIFQTYEPAEDPVGAFYEVRPGDFGMHLLLDAGDRVLPHVTSAVFPVLMDWLFAEPSRLRIVAEPDVRNERMIGRLRREGFTLGPEIDLDHKRARLTFLDRPS